MSDYLSDDIENAKPMNATVKYNVRHIECNISDLKKASPSRQYRSKGATSSKDVPMKPPRHNYVSRKDINKAPAQTFDERDLSNGLAAQYVQFHKTSLTHFKMMCCRL